MSDNIIPKDKAQNLEGIKNFFVGDSQKVEAAKKLDRYQQGLEEGKKIGVQEGIRQAQQQLATSLQTAQNLIKELGEAKNNIIKDSEEELIKLSIAIATHIVKEEVKQNKDIVLKVTKDAINQLVDKQQVIVRVSPADIKTIRDAGHELVALLGGEGKVEIIPDELVGQGGCIIQSRSGSIDAEISTQIDEVKANLLKRENDLES